MKRTVFAVAALGLTLFTLSGCGNGRYSPAPGSAATGTNPDRIVHISERTKYVNVMPFETVRFVTRDAAGKESSFDWRFDTFGLRVFLLSDISPSGFLGSRSIEVWVQRTLPQD